ncbi:hypothetical protein PkP19E3_25345 [Pseudomonas koreensis]|nr:hypothetical protein PkP19E3_25345 [Pseudomonas koreensis]
MDAYQRRRRIQFWLGSFPVLVGFTVLILALILASQEATLIPQELDAVSFSQLDLPLQNRTPTPRQIDAAAKRLNSLGER